MEDQQTQQEEARVLRWGGLAGVTGSIVLIVVFAIVIVFVGGDPAEAEGHVVRHPDIRAARIAENGLYLLAVILWIPHSMALYRVLRTSSLAPAWFGSVLGILGLIVLAAGALIHVATDRISDVYHAPGATAQDQATLVLIWQATQGVFEALLVAGLLLAPVGLIGLGLAMLRAREFSRGTGQFSVGLGVLGVGAAVTLLFTVSLMAAITMFALILFNLVLGWKLYRLPVTSAAESGPAVKRTPAMVGTR